MFDISKFGSGKVGINCKVSCNITDEAILKSIHLNTGDNCNVDIQGISKINRILKIHMVDNCALSLGKGQLMNGEVRLFLHEASTMKIGSDCLWGGTDIWTSDMHAIFDTSSGARTNFAEDISIGNRVWFGADTLVLKGARIGDDTVIGAKSVVIEGNYENNIVLSGYPAKKIKSGIIWDSSLLAVKQYPVP